MKKTLFTVTILLLVAAFGISAFMVGNYLLDGKKQADRMDDLSQIVSNAQTETTEAAETTEETAETTRPAATTAGGMLPGYKDIYEQNNDTVGWIKMEGTKINYPVLQTPDDPNYYLYRDFDKKDSTHGSIYAWSEADINEPSDNITLFGHHMADGSMFAALNDYTSKDAWDKNNLIFFDTLTEYHTYKIFAVFKTSANVGQGFSYHKFVDAANEQEFNEFVATCKNLAFYDTGITPVYGDKLICLSTCEYTLDNGRLVVAAVRIT
ncbi:MAG: class B sortase [Eubacteriales bacterium]|nr:class B sortase [Eubacteriales bacterium]